MTEHTSAAEEARQHLSLASVDAWRAAAEEIAPFDERVQIDRGQGPESAIFQDVVNIKNKDAPEGGTIPMVFLRWDDNTVSGVSVEDYLRWTGQTDETIAEAVHNSPSQVAARDQADFEAAKEARRLEEENARYRQIFTPMSMTRPALEGRLSFRPAPEQVQRAQSMLAEACRVDPGLENLLRGQGIYLSSNADTHALAVEAIRDSPETRFAVGLYLRSRLDDPAIVGQLPPRIKKNEEKLPSGLLAQQQLGELYGKDYAALLAMSMIDGTFNYEIEDPTYGEHRDVARRLLTQVFNEHAGRQLVSSV